jgi:hypothetical protein
MSFMPGFRGAPATALTGVTFIASASTSSSSALAIPGTAQAGDLALYTTRPSNLTESTISRSDPSGWTPINIFGSSPNGTYIRIDDYYKILTAGDLGGTVNGATSDSNQQYILIFRPNAGAKISSVTEESFERSSHGTTNPSLKTITPTFTPTILIAQNRCRGAAPSSSGTIKSNGTDIGNDPGSAYWYEIQNTTIASRTWDTSGAGTSQVTESYALSLA